MYKFPQVVYVRNDSSEKDVRGIIKASVFQSELMRVGKKSKVGVYRLMSVVDIAGKPEPKKSDTEKTAKKTAEKGKKE